MFHKFSQEYLRTYTERYGGGELCFRDGVVGEKSDKKLFFSFHKLFMHTGKVFFFLLCCCCFLLSLARLSENPFQFLLILLFCVKQKYLKT
jgi:hypothetical protein